MSKVDLKDANGAVFKSKTYQVDDDGQAVVAQAVVIADPISGDPTPVATETTLNSIATAVAALNTVSGQIKTALDALNDKTSTVNTSSVAGTVALDSATLAALETVTANTGIAQPLTDSALRASPVQVNVPGVATDAVVQAIAQLSDTLLYMVASILEKMPRVDAADRLVVTHSESNPTVSLASAQTLATLSDQTNIGGRSAAHMTYAMANAGALHIYDKITVS